MRVSLPLHTRIQVLRTGFREPNDGSDNQWIRDTNFRHTTPRLQIASQRHKMSSNYSIIRVTLNTELDTLWLFGVCAKTTCLNLMKPFAHESPLTCGENDTTYIMKVPHLDP